MACYARVSEQGQSCQLPGVVATSSGVNMAVFNAALLTAPATYEELQRAIAVCSSHYKSQGVGWSFWLCDDLVAPENRVTSRSLFYEKGLGMVARPPGMFAERIALPRRTVAGVDCRPIEDERTRLDFAHISSVVFALPFVTAQRIYCEPALWQPPMKGWVAYVNNKAVSVVSIVMAADAIGVYSLGTLPQHQGCGYGEALLRHAVEQARRDTGITRSILQTTDEGFNLYLRMGYRVVTSFSVYTRETCGRD
jgi:ribosomal protein S18 acetylase RimI-like enzyme